MLTSPCPLILHLRSVECRCPVQLELPRFPPKPHSLSLFLSLVSTLDAITFVREGSIPPFILDHKRESYQATKNCRGNEL